MDIFKIDWNHIAKSMTNSWVEWGGERLPVQFIVEDPEKVRMSEARFVFQGVYWHRALKTYRGFDIWGGEERLALLVQVTEEELATIEEERSKRLLAREEREAHREVYFV